VFTVTGSGLWNGLLIGLGALLGEQYHLIQEYSRFLNYAVYAALAAAILWLVFRKIRKGKGRGDAQDAEGGKARGTGSGQG
jgi:membrane protein DedA with SNARE-associated domain